MGPQSSLSVQSLCSVRLNSTTEEDEDNDVEEEEVGVRVDRRSDGGGGSVSDSVLKNDN